MPGKNNPDSITFKSRIRERDLELIYQLKIKRIAMGYSQQEATFVLGKTKGFVPHIERLYKNTRKKFADLCDVIYKLDHFLEHLEEVHVQGSLKRLTVRGLEYTKDGKIYHEMYIQHNDGSEELKWKIQEPDPDHSIPPEQQKETVQRITALLTTLVAIGYFNYIKATSSILHICRNAFGPVRPFDVEKALCHLIKSRLILVKEVQGYIFYIKKPG